MSVEALTGIRHPPTSAFGPMNRLGFATTLAIFLSTAAPPDSATASTYKLPRPIERTSSGPDGRIAQVPRQTTGQAVLEIRRRTGLTWQELSELFHVSRRSVHHWANGKPVTARHEHVICKIVDAIRHLDRGSQAATRRQLLAADDATGVSTFELLRVGHFNQAVARIAGVRTPERRRIPLAQTARDARRPPAPTLLLEASHERPEVPAKARTVLGARMPKT